MAKYETGLLPFGSGDEDIIISAALTSSTAIDSADTQGGGQDFTSDGMDVGANKALLWTGVTGQGRLDAEGTMRMEVDLGFVDKDTDPGADVYMLAHDGGTAGWMMLKESATTGIYPRPSTTFGTADEIFISTTGKDDQVELAVTWNMGSIYTWVDGLMVQKMFNDNAQKSGRFTNLYLGGDRTLANKGPNGQRIKNFEVIARQQQFPPHPEYGSMLFLGDSITNYGNMSTDMGTAIAGRIDKLPYFPGYGYSGIGVTTPGSSGQFFDVGYQATFFRQMFKNNVFPGKCWNESAPGENTNECLTRVNTFFDTNHYKANIAALFIGTNNCTNGGNLLSSANLDSIETDYKSIITKLNTEGVKKLVLVRIPTLSTHASFTANMNTNVDNFNARIDDLPAWATSQGYDVDIAIADVFNALGGHTSYAPYFDAGDIHPIELGSYTIGITVWNAMQSIL